MRIQGCESRCKKRWLDLGRKGSTPLSLEWILSVQWRVGKSAQQRPQCFWATRHASLLLTFVGFLELEQGAIDCLSCSMPPSLESPHRAQNCRGGKWTHGALALARVRQTQSSSREKASPLVTKHKSVGTHTLSLHWLAREMPGRRCPGKNLLQPKRSNPSWHNNFKESLCTEHTKLCSVEMQQVC